MRQQVFPGCQCCQEPGTCLAEAEEGRDPIPEWGSRWRCVAEAGVACRLQIQGTPVDWQKGLGKLGLRRRIGDGVGLVGPWSCPSGHPRHA